MDIKHKAVKIDLFKFSTPQMRAFHMTWLAFFLCFFAWFGIAPLMADVCTTLDVVDPHLTLKGLKAVYQRNQKAGA